MKTKHDRVGADESVGLECINRQFWSKKTKEGTKEEESNKDQI